MRHIPNIPSGAAAGPPGPPGPPGPGALDNLAGTKAPKATDDSTAGYSAGSLWVWPLSATSIGYGVWICTDATPAAAVWRRIEAVNVLAGAAPTVVDDASAGYSLGSFWVWQEHGLWVNFDPALGAAIWVLIGVLNNPAGAAPPTVNDDSTVGYGIGSLWIGPNNDVWTCTDATAGAAVWASLAQPAANIQAGAYAIAARDIGNVIFATGAGAQAFSLPDLSTAIGSIGSALPQAARMAIVTIQQVNAATLVTITPGAGSQINGAGVGVPYVLAVGRSRVSLFSYDGLNWISSDAEVVTVWGSDAIPVTTDFSFSDYPNGAVLLIDTAAVGAINGQLPTPVRGLIYTVTDIQGNLATNAFTAVRAAAEKIGNVAANYVFDANYGTITFICDGTDWWVFVDVEVAQPSVNIQAAGYALKRSDIGNVVYATGAGAQAFTLPDLSAAITAKPGTMLILTIVCENAATAVTITPGAGVGTGINNAGVGVPYAAPAGGTISLKSRDGLSWVAR